MMNFEVLIIALISLIIALMGIMMVMIIHLYSRITHLYSRISKIEEMLHEFQIELFHQHEDILWIKFQYGYNPQKDLKEKKEE